MRGLRGRGRHPRERDPVAGAVSLADRAEQESTVPPEMLVPSAERVSPQADRAAGSPLSSQLCGSLVAALLAEQKTATVRG
jgi:hypothetical protein